MNGLRVFENTEFGSIRALEIDNTPYFVGKDIAEALGYSNTKDAILTHVDEEDKRIIQRSDFTTIENHIPKTVFPQDKIRNKCRCTLSEAEQRNTNGKNGKEKVLCKVYSERLYTTRD